MFRELGELGQQLEREGKLPPPGFYYYKEPIKWMVHVWPDQPGKFEIADSETNKDPRPFSGRTSGVQAHLFTDEAAYALGVDRGKGAGQKIAGKHQAFCALLKKAEQALEHNEPGIAKMIAGICDILKSGALKKDLKWSRIESKDWVSFVVEGQGTESVGQHLFKLPVIQKLWINELEEVCRLKDNDGKTVTGTCALSGEQKSLMGRIPLKVTLFKPIPLHSLNKDSFVSGIEGVQIFESAHVGQSLEAGDRIARVLNFLRSSPLHHRILVADRKSGKLEMDSPKNLFAFFWLKEDFPVQAGDTEIDPNELLKNASLVLGAQSSENDKDYQRGVGPPPDLSQLEALLSIPWTARASSLRLENNAFCLLMLSPNTGRISVREWFQVDLQALRINLKNFLDAQRIVAPNGLTTSCFTVPDMLRALEPANISKPAKKAEDLANPNIARNLLRTAYLGEPPPAGLLEAAVLCFRHPSLWQRYDSFQERERFATLQHQLAVVLKLLLSFSDKELRRTMDTLDGNKTRAYRCGQLLAILEEAQLRSANWRINTTLVDRFYGAACSAPCAVMGMLVSRATTDHFPNIRKNQKGYRDLEALMESVQSALDCAGGFPKTLKLAEQAEFSLGFYCQRADFSRQRANINIPNATNQEGESK